MTREAAYARRAERPMVLLSLVFLLVFALPVIRPDLPEAGRDGLRLANAAIWGAFAVDYVLRLALAEQRWRFVRRHPVELAAVALPALRPLRLLRLFSIGSMLAVRSRRSMAAQAGRLVVGAAVVLVFVGAVGVLDAERGAEGANITGFRDALWWASTTITTVGYGDRFPVTDQGRAVAVALMAVGIALVGMLTASIAAWFVREVAEAEEEALDPIEERLARIEAQLDQLLTERSRT